MISSIGLASWLAYRYFRTHEEKIQKSGTQAIEAAVFGLLGLMIAFNFAGTYSRFDAHRQIIVDEANAIGTAFSRLDLLEEKNRLPLQEKFIDYIDLRINFYPSIDDYSATVKNLRNTEEAQASIWRMAIESTANESQPSTRNLLIPAINQMFNAVTTRTVAVQMHTPIWIYLIFFFIIVICAVLSGISMAASERFSWIFVILFATVLVITIYIILDLEYPHMSLINLDFAQQTLIDLKKSMIEYTKLYSRSS